MEILLEIADRFSFDRTRNFNVVANFFPVQRRREPVKNRHISKEHDGKHIGHKHQVIVGKVKDAGNKRRKKDASEQKGEAQYDVFVE